MAQAFVTVNEKTYKWHDYTKKTKSLKPVELVYNQPPKANIFLDSHQLGGQAFGDTNVEGLLKFVKKLYRKRNRTTFQMSYCKQKIMAEDREDTEEVKISENELIEYGNRVFSEPTAKIMKPLPTARKLYGYIRPKTMYMGLTEYQEVIDRLGHRILLDNYNAAKKNKA